MARQLIFCAVLAVGSSLLLALPAVAQEQSAEACPKDSVANAPFSGSISTYYNDYDKIRSTTPSAPFGFPVVPEV